MHRRCKVVMLGAVHLEASPNNALERTVARPLSTGTQISPLVGSENSPPWVVF